MTGPADILAPVTKTLVDIPDELLAEAMELLGTRTKAETVRRALAESIRRRRTPAMERARRLNVVYTDGPIDVGEGISTELGEQLIAEIRADRDAD